MADGEKELISYDGILSGLLSINYFNVFENEEVRWQEISAATGLLLVLHSFSGAFIFGLESITEIAFQTSVMLLMLIILTVVCVSMERLFGLHRLQPRRVLLLLAGHYSTTLIAVLCAAFLWGGKYPFYNDVDTAMFLYPAIALTFYVLNSLGSRHQIDGQTPLKFGGAVVAVAVIVNLFNWRLFSALALNTDSAGFWKSLLGAGRELVL